MRIDSIRRGDVVVSADTLEPYRVMAIDHVRGRVRAKPDTKRSTRPRTFRADHLEEVDEGIWQELP